ncbi:hypothetical protein [Phenylobacterium kunshanense]|uniref:PilZ domain-containing protein n=1 Tax=Phenylobacterium kunshanense TaxID=1445034 RepID=A0A328BNK5_9CAUL|nr:hypothetical protein [Phenylobacterium kunshanense]RAK68683.1 hypothetical protein DJ019_01285 [Phenylobacterium kunshanense]
MPRMDPRIAPFFACGYEIRDAGAARGGAEFAILADDPLTPRLGDRFTLEGCGVVREVSVIALDQSPSGWRATCRVTDVF